MACSNQRFTAISDPRRQTYAAMLSAMDDGIGRVLDTLRRQNLEQNTLVWFLSDNGGPPEKAAPTNNSPLRGYKGQVYEGGIRVPFVAQWPAKLPARAVDDQPVISLDLLVTAAALAGARLPAGLKLDGVDVIPHVLGQVPSPPHDVLHWRMAGSRPWAIRQGRYKLLAPAGDNPLELYDLEADISEKVNLADKHPDIVERLNDLHVAWNAELIPPRWGNPPVAPAKPKPGAALPKVR